MATARSAEEWQQLFADYEASAESAPDFCARHGLRLVYFYRRSWELRRRSASRRESASGSAVSGSAVRRPVASAFMPVTVPRAEPAEIRLTCGPAEMIVSSAVAPEWVAALVSALTRGAAA